MLVCVKKVQHTVCKTDCMWRDDKYDQLAPSTGYVTYYKQSPNLIYVLDKVKTIFFNG